MVEQRIVITGIGALTPVGNTIDTTWQALLQGESGLGPVTLFDPSRIGCEVAAEVKGFDVEAMFGRREARKMDRVTGLSMAAAREAWANAGTPQVEPSRGGVIFGTAVGGMQMVIDQAAVLAERPDRLSPHFLPNFLVDTPTSYIATDLTLRGPNFAVVSACATGAHAIGEASDMIRRGDADVMLAGGAECGVLEVAAGRLHGHEGARQAATRRAHATASRPFDATRDGFVIGEGAAVLVLEALDDARAPRRAASIAEVRRLRRVERRVPHRRAAPRGHRRDRDDARGPASARASRPRRSAT